MRRSEEEKSAFLEGGPQADDIHTPYRRYQAYPIVSTVLILVTVVSGFIGFYTGQLFPSNKACAQEYTSWSPARNTIRYEARQVEGAFFAPSKFRGQPSAEIDAAWDDIWQIGGIPIRVEDSDLVHLGKSPDRNWSRIPEELGGGIRGYPNVFHQLHCLNTLRKVSYKEHYMHDKLFTDPSHISRGHIDHCIEIIRQQLMCSAEMVPVLTEELEGHEFPRSDFSTWQVCRNFDDLYAWTKSAIIHGGGNWDLPSQHHNGH